MEIRKIEENGVIYYMGRDIANLLGYSNPRKALRDHCEGFKKTLEITFIDKMGRKQAQAPTFITEEGVLALISKSRTKSAEEKKRILEEIGIQEKVVLTSRMEIEFMSSLEIVLAQMGLTLETQKSVLGYRIDGYIKEIDIAIEYDEEQHKYSKAEDKKRQKKLERELNCKFIRLDYQDNDFINIGKVMNFIMLNK